MSTHCFSFAAIAAFGLFSSFFSVARAQGGARVVPAPHDETHSEAPGAHDAASRWRSIDVVALGGVGTPLGFGGLALDWSPSRFFAVYAGTGLSAHGPQSALLARVRVPIDDRFAIAVGAGPSYGRYESTSATTQRTWSLATWMNAEVSLEHRDSSPVHVRIYAGLGGLLDPAAATCTGAASACAAARGGTVIGYAGVALGFSL